MCVQSPWAMAGRADDEAPQDVAGSGVRRIVPVLKAVQHGPFSETEAVTGPRNHAPGAAPIMHIMSE